MDRRTVVLVVTALFAAVGSLDSLWSLYERLQGGINLGEIVSAIRLISGPLALLLVLFLVWRPARGRRSFPRAPDRYRPEWASKDRPGHWNGIREMATEVRNDLRDELNRSGDHVTVKDRANMEARVELLETNVAEYEEIWSRTGSFWNQRLRDRWERDHRNAPERPVHTWAVDLWQRVEFAISWIYGHPPEQRPPGYAGLDAWGGWSDMGS